MKQILIHDCAVSLAPKSWKKKNKIAEYFKKTGRMPLINASTHQHLLRDIPLERRMDRPDILHFALLLSLNYAKIRDLEVLFSVGNVLYKVDGETRLPRDQQRFYGVLESVLAGKLNPFIQRLDEKLDNMLKGDIWFFSRTGDSGFKHIDVPEDLTLVFGGRAHSAPRSDELSIHKKLNLGDQPLELWTALSIVLPHVLGLP